MERIVVGYDGSETARLAAAEAATFASGTGAEFHLLNVVDDAGLRQGMVTADLHQHDLDHAAAANAVLIDSLPNLGIHSHVKVGSAADTILKFAKSIDADLIVLGNKRVQGLERLLGSVAVAVLRHAPCSVYVAHTA